MLAVVAAGNSGVDVKPPPQPPAVQVVTQPPQTQAVTQPPQTMAVQAPDAVAAAEAAVRAMIEQGATPADALAAHPLPAGMSSADVLAFLATLPQTQAYLALDAPPQVITGPPIATLLGDTTDEEIPDPTALDGWSFDPFFGEGGGLSVDEASAKILRGTAFTNSVQAHSAANDLDVLGVYANAIAEGLSGGIGDSGSAYGPWQTHLTDGRLPQFSGDPPYDLEVQGWAWTDNGVDYVCRSMRAGGAKGLKGHAAVHAIVYGFERPADEAGAYTTRSAIYDTLLAKGSGVTAYIAGIAQGPSLTPATTAEGQTTVENVTPAAISNVPTGTAWTNLMTFMAKDIPYAATHAKNVSSDLINLLK